MRIAALFLTLTLCTPALAGQPFAAFDAASEAVLGNPHDLEVGPDGRLYVADVDNNRVAILDAGTLELVGEIDGLSGPHDVAFDAAGRMLVADTHAGRIAIFEKADDWQPAGELTGDLWRTEGVTAHPNGRIYATSAGGGTVTAFENGTAVAQAGGMSVPHDVAVDGEGNLWVADTGNGRLLRFSPKLEPLGALDDAAYGFRGPRYLDVDAAGNLVVADKESHRVLRLSPAGAILGVIGEKRGLGPNLFTTPEGVEILEGRYYFSDSGNDRIVRYLVVTN